MKRFCGIDLAAKERNPTGIVCIDQRGKILEEGILFKDRDIMAFVKRNRPAVIAIDAPLSLPSGGKMREEERRLTAMGHKVFPFFKSMVELAKRGICLSEGLQKEGYDIIEVHPFTSEKVLKGVKGLKKKLKKKERGVRRHVHDAITAARTALLYAKGKCERIAGVLYIPKS